MIDNKTVEEMAAGIKELNEKLSKIIQDQETIMSHFDSQGLEFRKRIEKIESQLGTATSI